MITRHFFKMVMTFIGVLLVGIIVLFFVSMVEDKSTKKTTVPVQSDMGNGIGVPGVDVHK
jgi:ABC-type transporter Mla subunit MlaD